MNRTRLVLFPLLLCLVIATPARAAFDYYLRLDGIPGESTAKGYEKWIGVGAYDFGVGNVTGGGGSGGGTGKTVFDDFSFTKLLDSASPKIFEAVVLGTHIRSAELDIVQSGEARQKVFSYSFDDVLFASVHDSGTEPDRPAERAVFGFGTVKFQSYLLDPKGGSTLGPSFEFDVASAATVPEPATWLSMVAGLAVLAGGLGLHRRRPTFGGRTT